MEKGGLAANLTAAGVRRGQRVAWADEMRLGLHGQVRRRWTLRGVKLRQAVEVQYVWQYLALAVEVTGRLTWRWLNHLRKEAVVETVQEWRIAGVDAVVWDRAPSHRARAVREVGMPLIEQPPYAPELNPPERVFEELRRAVEGACPSWRSQRERSEGIVYGTIESKVMAVETFLQELAADIPRVQRLVGWSWIHQALADLPETNMASG